MDVFFKKFHGQLHFLFHRHLHHQLILHILKTKPRAHTHTPTRLGQAPLPLPLMHRRQLRPDLSELTLLLQLPPSLIVHLIQTLTRLLVRVSLH